MRFNEILNEDGILSQELSILRRLESGVTMTPIDALNDPEIRCMRLAGRIFELKRMGYQIETLKVETSTGKHCAGYRLARRVEPSGQVLLTI